MGIFSAFLPAYSSRRGQFQHTPLSGTGEPRTRIIEVLPAKTESAPIKTRLREAPVDNPPQPYDAVSYRWDDQKPKRTIQCNAKLLEVTANAEGAIRGLRDRSGSIYLWIDAICIMQEQSGAASDKKRQIEEDKERQINCMADIYRNAARVVVWLPDMPLENNVSVLRSASHSYWSRVWTYQEFTLNPRCFIHLGDGKHAGISKTDFIKHFRDPVYGASIAQNTIHLARATTWGNPISYESEIFDSLPHLNCTDDHDRVYALKSVYPELLGQVTIDYKRTLAETYTDAAVCIIAATGSLSILSFAGQSDGTTKNCPSWVPDLTRKRAAMTVGGPQMRYLYLSGALNSRPLLQLNERGIALRATPRMSAGFNTTIKPARDECLLRVRAVVLDTVRHVSELFQEQAAEPDFKTKPVESAQNRSIRDSFLGLCVENFGNLVVREQFLRLLSFFVISLSCDQISITAELDSGIPEGQSPGKDEGVAAGGGLQAWIDACCSEEDLPHSEHDKALIRAMKAWVDARVSATGESEAWERTLTLGPERGADPLASVVQTFRMITAQQRLLMTKDRVMGICQYVQPEDQIALVEGCDKPFVLRKVTNNPEDPEYRLVGETFLNVSISSGSDGSDDASFDANDSSDEVGGDEDQDMDDAGDEEETDMRSLSASPSPLSWSSSRVSIQLQRVKCNVCNFWFDDAEELETHKDTYGASCCEHGVCFPQDDLYDHAREYVHKRCFVPGCNSAFAKHDHSDDEKVEDHIYYTHARRP
ncbi:hypothetical protein INS49_003552 [Diaporthe citri]|uniref:uncharacterized protein n=1 Tax=Diaporthe citri TaxID=83186 RepID=UPI001C80AC05|nr:uncharacterized protein INS49_003552 [Diaporthe citri]KAG6355590.1 hypothetical protein INS49_003552 [Diaporthe citri]